MLIYNLSKQEISNRDSFCFPYCFFIVVYKILTEHLQYKNIFVKWVPRMLTSETNRREWLHFKHFLTTSITKQMTFLDHTVLKRWDCIPGYPYCTSEIKRHIFQPKLEKLKATFNQKMVIVLLDWISIFLIGYLVQGETINIEN